MKKKKPTYSELEKRVAELEKEATDSKDCQSFEDLLNLLDDIVIIIGEDYTVEDINPSGEKYFSKKREEVIGRKCHDLFKYNEKNSAPCSFCNIDTDREVSNTIQYDKKTKCWLSVKVSGFKSPDGSVKYIDIIRDVTDLIEKEEGMLEMNKEYAKTMAELMKANRIAEANEQKYRMIFEGSPLGIFRSTLDGRFLDVNPAMADILGYDSPEEVINEITDISEQIYVFTERRKEFIMKTQTNDISIYENLYKRKNGEYFYANLYIRKVQDFDGNEVLEGLVEETTERKKYEKELKIAIKKAKESEEKATSLLTAIPDMIFLFDEEGRFVDYRAEDQKVLLIPSQEFLGKKLENVLPQKLADLTLNKMKVVRDTGQLQQYTYSVEIEGKERFFDSRMVKAYGDNYLAIVRDVTDQHIAKLRLLEAKDRAEESDRLKTEFLHNMSHEIRTPMNGIIGFADLLATPGISGESRDHFTKLIKNSSHQLLQIIDEVLEMARLQSGDVTTEIEPLVLNHIMMSLFSAYNPKASDSGLALYVKKGADEKSGIVETDSEKIRRIMEHLLDNALKFTSKGSVEFGYYLNEDKIILFVRDTGDGIAPEYIEKIFDRFTQEEKEMTRKADGLGLGLAIVKEYADLLGAEIKVESEKGKGSEFMIILPYNKEEFGASNDKNLSDISILIAEDEELNFMYLESLLTINPRFSFNSVMHAKNGVEAVELCREYNDIALVLMDIKMPEMSGLEATQKIKTERPDLPILAQTAYTSPEDKKRVFDAGCDGFIPKPINSDDLFAAVSKYLKPRLDEK